MVPVPEEHVEEAMQAVLRLVARAKITDWDEVSFIEQFRAVDEPTRAVLSLVGRSSGPVVDQDVADAIEISVREVLGIVRELNERCQAAERPSLVVVRTETETLPSGRTRDQRLLQVADDVSGFVREAERLEAEEAPHPLLSNPR